MKFSRLLATGKSLIGMRDADSPYRMRKGTLLPKFESVKNPFLVTTKAGGNPPGGAVGEPSVMMEMRAFVPPGGTPGSTAGGTPAATTARMETSLLFDEELRPVALAAGGEDGSYGNNRSHGKEVAEAAKPEAQVAVKPTKVAPVVGLMDASPLGLKTGVAPKNEAAAPALVEQPVARPAEQPVSRPAERPVARPIQKAAVKSNESNIFGGLVKKLNPLAYLPVRPVENLRRSAVQTELLLQKPSLDKVTVLRNELNDTDLDVIPRRAALKPGASEVRLQAGSRSEPTALGRLTSRFFGQGQPQAR